MVGVAPAVAVEQVAAVPHRFVVVELKLVPLDCPPEHDSHEHPRAHVEAGELDEYFALGLADLDKAGPVHLLVSGFDNAVTHPKEVLAGIGPQHVLRLYLPSLQDSLLRLLVELGRHDL